MKDHACVTDFHSHVLPVDHGCKDTDQAVKQLCLMHSSGTEAVVATPHFYPEVHTVDAFTASLDDALDQLCQTKDVQLPSLYVGAEVLYCHNLDMMNGLEALCIRGTKVLLLELTSDVDENGQADCIQRLLKRGFTIVLAHIDRYLKDHDEEIRSLISLGAYAQINAASLYSSSLKKRLRYYLEETDSVVALGSDLHGVDKAVYRKFAKLPSCLDTAYGEIMKRSESLLSGAQKIL